MGKLLALVLTAGLVATACSGAPPPDALADRTDLADRDLPLAQASADGFVLRHPRGDVDFVTGINVGSAIPARWPSELAVTAETWRRWLPMIAATGVHAIRIYTVQMPSFYRELAAHNEANPDDPLFLIHGVWVPEDLMLEGRDLFAPEVLEQAHRDIDDAVAVVHGDAVLPERRGYASGTFDVDVSPWVMSWAYGIEMDPELVAENDEHHRGRVYDGRYVTTTDDATPTEAWLAEMLDRLATRETERGRTVPLTASNWPTTDPLDHPDEPLRSEDLVGIDMNHLPATADWPAGTYASYHAYPYYPDFQRYEPGIADHHHDGQRDPYAGYLTRLRDHHAAAGLPMMVLEFGLPTSLGSAHLGPVGRDQGGLDEAEAMGHLADMLRTQHDLGLSGGMVFAWQDEWFKRTWNTMETELPAERRPLWSNPLTNEAFFGLLAIEAGAEPSPIVIDGDGDDWQPGASQVLHEARQGVREVRVRHDAAYLYLRLVLDGPDRWLDAPVVVGFDLIEGGNPLTALTGARADTGDLGPRFETAIVVGPGSTAAAHVRASNDYNAVVLGRAQGLHDVDPADLAPEAEVWNPQRLLVNRPVEVPGHGHRPAEWFDLNPLVTGSSDPASPEFDSRTLWAAEGSVIELRVPWAMVGFTDPSSLSALVVEPDGRFRAEPVAELGIGVAVGGVGAMTNPYRWEGWNAVEWHERLKVGVDRFTAAVADVRDR